jgi:hypothetical protein
MPGPQNGVLSAPQMALPPLAAGQGQPPGGQPQQGAPPPPTPTHGQTVAVLRHMDAIQHELETLLKDAAAGKSNMKSKIIDGVTKLVAGRIITPGAAVSQLGGVPEKPFDQKKWLQQHLQQAMQAKVFVLQHHGNAFAGTPEDEIDKTSSPDDHMSDMAAVSGHYAGAGRG